jgi:hypothetical protein
MSVIKVNTIQNANGTTGITFAANGQMTLANTPLQLTGGQIKFPATQIASGDANTLDDYEEGTWTPAIPGATSYGARTGLYTKIGNMVWAMFQVGGAVGGSPSGNQITGLPFTSTSTSGTMRWAGSLANAQNFSSGGVFPMCEVSEGASYIAFYGYNNGAAYVGSNFASGSSGGSWFIQGYVCYMAS